MINTYKYITRIHDTTSLQLELYVGRETRGHSKKLAKAQVHRQIREELFKERVVTTWNSLPESVVTAPTLNSFKRRLDTHWQDHPRLFKKTIDAKHQRRGKRISRIT